MKIYSEAITGKEKQFFSQEHEALVEFYKAFNTQDIKLMQKNWSEREGVMDNPLGGILREWRNIREVYKKIFFGDARVYVEFYDYSVHTNKDMFFAAGRERGYIMKNGKKINLDIRTSRIYTKENSKYRQLHHHGSITDAKLLDTYQKLVLEEKP